MASKVDLEFAREVSAADDFNAWACMNCGVCTAVCPLGIDLVPRKLFRYTVLGLKDEVLERRDVIFQCLLCKLCEENCTAGVNIAENMRYLRGYIDREVFGLSADPAGKKEQHAVAHR